MEAELYAHLKEQRKTVVGELLQQAQEHYFLGDTDNARVILKVYFDAIVQQGPSHCQACNKICAKDAIMDKCSVCKVSRYCSEAHNIQGWMDGRPALPQGHVPIFDALAQGEEGEGEDNVESSNAILNDFFESLDELAYTHGRKVGFATR